MLRRSFLAALCTLLLAAFTAWAPPLAAQETPQRLAQQPAPEEARPRNVILFIADGLGPASVTMARDYRRAYEGSQTLALDDILVGTVRTYSADSRVTDSAAGATAFSAGVKTYNGAIAVDTLQQPVATVLEAARARGMATGLVATSRITHATPASFAAHVPSRDMENEIAAQMMAQGVDVVFGGGRRHFLPVDHDGLREDDRNLLEEAEAAGVQVVLTREVFDGALQTPVLGLLNMDHMAYEIDRDSLVEPSLAEMTVKAIDLLRNEQEGFLLMVEGSRIDHAGHANDPAAHLRDILAYDRAVAAALDFARQDGQTLVIGVSDHETGGLTLGRGVDGAAVYGWNPAVLAQVRTSLGPMVGELLTLETRAPTDVLRERAGISSLTEEEEALLQAALADGGRLELALSEIISRRALIGWTTPGHTGVDVPLYAFGPGRERLIGHHDNTFIGQLIAALFDFDLGALTASLRQEAGSR